MNQGIYEELITKLVATKINELDDEAFYIKKTKIDKEEASLLLSQHLAKVIRLAFSMIKGDHILEQQIKIANDIIQLLKTELKKEDFEDDLIEIEGRILKAIYQKLNAD